MDIGGGWGLVVGLIGVGLAVWFYVRRDVKPALVYRITQNRPLLGGTSLETKAISVNVGSSIVKEPWVWGAAFTNTGKAPIRPADFDSAITFRFENSATFLQVQSVGECRLAMDEDRANNVLDLGIAPQVINPGETLEIAALTDGRIEADKPRGKIAGVKKIIQIDDEQEEWARKERRKELTLLGIFAVVANVIAWFMIESAP